MLFIQVIIAKKPSAEQIASILKGKDKEPLKDDKTQPHPEPEPNGRRRKRMTEVLKGVDW